VCSWDDFCDGDGERRESEDGMSTPRVAIVLIHLHEPVGWRYLVYDRLTHRWAGEENGYATSEEAERYAEQLGDAVKARTA
jgi:hypothetical protein